MGENKDWGDRRTKSSGQRSVLCFAPVAKICAGEMHRRNCGMLALPCDHSHTDGMFVDVLFFPLLLHKC